MKRLFLLAAIALIAGCGGSEERSLTAIRDRLAADRADRMRLTNDLAPATREVATLEAELAAIRDPSSDPQNFAALLTELAAKTHTSTAFHDREGAFSLTAPGGATTALDTIAAAAPAAGLSHLSVTPHGFTATLVRIEAAPAITPSPIPSPTPLALPPPARFPSKKSARLRAEIQRLEEELILFDAIRDQSARLAARRATAEARVRSLERADRLVNAMGAVDALLEAPVLSTAEFTLDADRIAIHGTLAKDAPIDLALAALAKRWEVSRKDSAGSIDLELSRRSTN